MSAPKAQEYDSRRETNQMKYGIYFAYWEKEWNVDQKKYISKVKDLGFDILEISCAMLKNISKNELLEMKKMAEDAGVMLTAGYGPNAKENLGSSDPEVVKNAIAFYTDILKKLEILDIIPLAGVFILTGRWIIPSRLIKQETGQEVLPMCVQLVKLPENAAWNTVLRF